MIHKNYIKYDELKTDNNEGESEKKNTYSTVIQALLSSMFSTWELNWSNIQMRRPQRLTQKKRKRKKERRLIRGCIYMQMHKLMRNNTPTYIIA